MEQIQALTSPRDPKQAECVTFPMVAQLKPEHSSLTLQQFAEQLAEQYKDTPVNRKCAIGVNLIEITFNFILQDGKS